MWQRAEMLQHLRAEGIAGLRENATRGRPRDFVSEAVQDVLNNTYIYNVPTCPT